MKQPTLILMRGLPGSGKTFIASQLKKDIENVLGKDSVIMLDPDAINKSSSIYLQAKEQFVRDGIEEKFHPYRFLRGIAEHAVIDRKVIIWNQPFTLRGGFERTIDYLADFASQRDIELPVLVVEVWVDPETARARIAERKAQGGHGPSEAAFQQFIDDYVSFAEMGHPTISIQGEDDVVSSVKLIRDKLTNL